MSTDHLKYGVSVDIVRDFRKLQSRRKSAKDSRLSRTAQSDISNMGALFENVKISCGESQQLGLALVTINETARFLDITMNQSPLAAGFQRMPFDFMVRKEVNWKQVTLQIVLPEVGGPQNVFFGIYVDANVQPIRNYKWHFQFATTDEAILASEYIDISKNTLPINVTSAFSDDENSSYSSSSNSDDSGTGKTTEKLAGDSSTDE